MKTPVVQKIFLLLVALKLASCRLPQFKVSIEDAKLETRESGMTTLVYTFEDGGDLPCSSCNSTLSTLKNLSNVLSYSLVTILINCSSPETASDAHFNSTCVKRLPEITVIEPANQLETNPNELDENERLKYHVIQTESPSLKGLAEFVESLSVFKGDVITTERDWVDFLNQSSLHLKRLLFFQQGGSPLKVFKVLSSYFYRRFEIALIKSPDHSLVSLLKIDEQPTVVLLSPNLTLGEADAVLLRKSGEKVTVEEIVKHLNIHANIRRLRREALPVSKSNLQGNRAPDFYKTADQEREFNLTFKNLEKTVLESEKLFLIHAFKQDQTHWAFEQIRARLGPQFDYGLLNCTKSKTEASLRKILGPVTLPALIFIALPRERNISERAMIVNQVGDLNNLLRKISDLIQDKSKSVKDEEDLGFYLKKAFEAKKTPVILFHNQTGVLSQSFRLATNIKSFGNYFRFFNVYNASKETLSKYKIKSLPRILSLIDTPHSTEVLQLSTGFSFANITRFLAENLEEINRENLGKVYLPRIKDSRDFNRICVSEESAVCFVLFVTLDKLRFDYVNHIETVETFLTREFPTSKTARFAWADFHDFPKLNKALQLEAFHLPKVVALITDGARLAGEEQLRFSHHLGAFSLESLEIFIMRTLNETKFQRTVDAHLGPLFEKAEQLSRAENKKNDL